MLIAHKVALAPNNVQRNSLARAAGTARFAYNWALAEWQRQYEAWKADNRLSKPTQYALRRQLNAIKRDRFPWMLEVTKNAPQMAIVQLGVAFKNFFSGHARYPRFRKKGIRDRFTLTNDQFHLDGLAEGVIEATIGRFAVPPREILCWLGPAICLQAFEVGAEVQARFLAQGDEDTKAAFVPVAGSESGWLANLYALARERLHACGVDRVCGGGLCTYSDPGRFFSYRRDKVTGRMASLIWIYPDAGR